MPAGVPSSSGLTGGRRSRSTRRPTVWGYELTKGVEEPEHSVLRIEWDSLEGHERGFRSSPEFRTFFANVSPFVGDIQEMRHYDIVGLQSKKHASE